LRSQGTSRSDDASAEHDRRLGNAGKTFKGPDARGLRPPTASVKARMSRTGRRDTAPEVKLRRLLHAAGLRYRIDRPALPGLRRRPDIVFGPSKVAVFVDGCFWHGCPEHATWPKNNAEFWRKKIETNRERDRDTDQRLGDAGWEVIRVWEHEDPAPAASRIERIVRRRS
jgi:DNA mismatch endonuclease (patch repair protein)